MTHPQYLVIVRRSQVPLMMPSVSDEQTSSARISSFIFNFICKRTLTFMAAVLTASSNGGVCEDEVLVGEGNIPSGYNESIPTKLTYYVRDSKHEHEKGYEIRYDTGGVIPDTNTSEEVKAITVTNFRPIQSEQTFQTYGFKSARIDCSLSAQDYDDSAKVENVYYPAVLDALKKEYPDAGDIRVLEHRVSS